MSKRHRTARADSLASAVYGSVAVRHAATPYPQPRPRTPVQELRSLRRVRESLAVRERAAVVTCRREGMTWSAIATELGLDTTVVFRRYRDLDVPA